MTPLKKEDESLVRLGLMQLEDCLREARRQETATMSLHSKLVNLRLDMLARLSHIEEDSHPGKADEPDDPFTTQAEGK